MIAAALCIALGGVSFKQVEIPDLSIGYNAYFAGERQTNFRHADIDRDGQLDLVLPARAYLGSGDGFSPGRFVSMPEVESDSRADFWEGALYLLSATKLTAYVFEDGAWNRTLSAECDWKLVNTYHVEPEENRPPIAFERFLHDVDGDGHPEVLRVDDPGIAVSVLRDGRVETTHLNLYPSPRLSTYTGHAALWPASERYVSLPSRVILFDVLVDGDSATVVERIRHKGGVFAFGVEQYRILATPGGGFAAERESAYQTEPLPRHVMFPYALNQDDTIDFAGRAYDRPEYKNWKPLLRSFATTDGGKTIQTAASRGFESRTVFIDLDNDGDLDWIGGESGLVSGGLRETANRALFQRTFSHTILARMQEDGGRFESKWRKLGRFTIELDAPPRRFSYRFWQYRKGDLIDCTGDFNGDGWRDALVSDRPESVSLFLGGPSGFSKRAETKIDIARDARPVAIDIDGDKLSDIAVIWHYNYAPQAIYLNEGGK